MTHSTDLPMNKAPSEAFLPPWVPETVRAEPVVPSHPAEADIFARQAGIPGHDQEVLANACLVLVGAGGLNSWTALGLARTGARSLTIIDPDIADRTNLPRQLYFPDDLGKPKAGRLARNLVPHALAGGQVTGISLPFQEAVQAFALPADVLVVGVDNNACRLQCVREARGRGIPAVFTMLSLDGLRCQSFLQGPNEADPCLWCALPNLDPEGAAPCAAAIISSCFLAAALAVFSRTGRSWAGLRVWSCSTSGREISWALLRIGWGGSPRDGIALCAGRERSNRNKDGER